MSTKTSSGKPEKKPDIKKIEKDIEAKRRNGSTPKPIAKTTKTQNNTDAKPAGAPEPKKSTTSFVEKKKCPLILRIFLIILVGLVIWFLMFTFSHKVGSNQQSTLPSLATADTPEESTEVVVEKKSLMVIGRDDVYQVIDTAVRSKTFQPAWPEGTDQTSVGYSNPEEFPDGRTFMTRSQSNPNEVMAFVARCISINNGPQYCHSDESGALVGLIIGHPDGEYPVKLWDAELKTLTIPGGAENWKAYIYELANFISANKGGKLVEILGSAK
ncbi:MAG: hypothetical protein WAX66_01885 [Patescibacteria group bacterium]